MTLRGCLLLKPSSALQSPSFPSSFPVCVFRLMMKLWNWQGQCPVFSIRHVKGGKRPVSALRHALLHHYLCFFFLLPSTNFTTQYPLLLAFFFFGVGHHWFRQSPTNSSGSVRCDMQQSRWKEGSSVLTIGDNRTQHSVELVSVRRNAVLWTPAQVSIHPAVVHHWHNLALTTEQPWETEREREREVRRLQAAAQCLDKHSHVNRPITRAHTATQT